MFGFRRPERAICTGRGVTGGYSLTLFPVHTAGNRYVVADREAQCVFMESVDAGALEEGATESLAGFSVTQVPGEDGRVRLAAGY